jgi:hypothetical protein
MLFPELDVLSLPVKRSQEWSVQYGRRQEFEVADLQFAAFIYENDLKIEIGIKNPRPSSTVPR